MTKALKATSFMMISMKKNFVPHSGDNHKGRFDFRESTKVRSSGCDFTSMAEVTGTVLPAQSRLITGNGHAE